MSRELLQDAAWALKDLISAYPETACIETRISAQKVIAALRQELAKPEQEFYPDWDMLKPFYERIKELEEQLAKPEQELPTLHQVVIESALKGYGKPEPTPRQLQRLRQEAWKSVRDVYRDDPEVCFAMGFDAGYGAVASKVEPSQEECGGFDSRPAPLAQPEQEPKLSDAGADTNLRILSMEEQAALRSPLIFVHQPPRKEWVGLTDDEMLKTLIEIDSKTVRLPIGFKLFARAIEAKLKEKNT